MRLPPQIFAISSAAFSLVLGLSFPLVGKAACLPTNPSSSCSTFLPATPSSLSGFDSFSGSYVANTAADPLNIYSSARIEFSLSEGWATTFTIDGISLTGDGINTALNFPDMLINTAKFGPQRTGWLPLNTDVVNLDFSGTTLSYNIPSGVASIGATLEARVSYRSANQSTVSPSLNNTHSTAVPGPMGFLGLGAGFTQARQLRRRFRTR